MVFDELLPIGSVVILKGATKKIMIFGIGQIDGTKNIAYDYVGVLYPEGNLGDGSHFLFNQNDIESVYFRGCDDEERKTFVSQLNQALKTP